jgi:zinc transport system substrate-binding protein
MLNNLQKNHKILIYFISLIILVLIVGILAIQYFSNNEKKTQKNSSELKITVSTFAVYSLVKELDPKLNISQVIMNIETETHEFSPNPKDIQKVNNSDIFIYFGTVDAWATNFLTGASKNLKVLKIEDKLNQLQKIPKTNYDPHLWLDFDLSLVITQIIRDALTQKYPNQKTELNKNFSNFEKQLNLLQKNYIQKLQNCTQNLILVEHNAFSYLGEKYDFQIYNLYDNEEEEMTASRILQLKSLIKEKNLKYVFTSHPDSVIVQEIKKQNNLEVLTLNSMEFGQSQDTYWSLNNQNLETLSIGMQCEKV